MFSLLNQSSPIRMAGTSDLKLLLLWKLMATISSITASFSAYEILVLVFWVNQKFSKSACSITSFCSSSKLSFCFFLSREKFGKRKFSENLPLIVRVLFLLWLSFVNYLISNTCSIRVCDSWVKRYDEAKILSHLKELLLFQKLGLLNIDKRFKNNF